MPGGRLADPRMSGCCCAKADGALESEKERKRERTRASERASEREGERASKRER